MDPLTDGTAADEPGTTPTPAGSQSPEDILAGLEEAPPPATAAAPAFDEDFLTRLGSIDPKDLPESIRQKLELPFKQDHTKKTQDLAREREQLSQERARNEAQVSRLVETVERLANNRGTDATVTPDERELLRQKIAEGDTEAITAYVDKLFTDKVENDPRMVQMSQKEALAEAARLMPKLPEYETDVAQYLRSDPAILQLATMNRGQYLPKVLAGLAFQVHSQKLQAHIDGEAERMKTYGRQVLEAYKAKVRGAPSITSRAGSTPGGTSDNGDSPSLREALEEAWNENVNRQ
jgi:hypothetical protein